MEHASHIAGQSEAEGLAQTHIYGEARSDGDTVSSRVTCTERVRAVTTLRHPTFTLSERFHMCKECNDAVTEALAPTAPLVTSGEGGIDEFMGLDLTPFGDLHSEAQYAADWIRGGCNASHANPRSIIANLETFTARCVEVLSAIPPTDADLGEAMRKFYLEHGEIEAGGVAREFDRPPNSADHDDIARRVDSLITHLLETI